MNSAGRPRHWWLQGALLALAGAALLSGGTNTGTAVSTVPETTESAAATLPPEYQPPTDPRELLQVDDAMRTFFRPRVTGRRCDSFTLHQIVEAIVTREGLNFAYDGVNTYDAHETFVRRRGNCLAFALLVMAIVREYRFDASFQTVELPARWDRYGDNIASIQHVNVRVETEEGPFIVDLRPDLIPRVDSYSLASVPDERVFADFYSDYGFFRLVHGRELDALRAMVRATEIDPDSASAWANRATLHARLGDLASARRCFERSLRLDSRGLHAVVGFVNVLERTGRPEDLRIAAQLQRRAQSLRERNPYYHEYLAQTARERGDWTAAEKSFRRAIGLKDDEPDFYVQWAAALRQLGRTRDADRATVKLEKLRTRLASKSEHLVP